jgi:hypothetical protein
MPSANRMTTPVAVDEAQIEGRYAPRLIGRRWPTHSASRALQQVRPPLPTTLTKVSETPRSALTGWSEES